MKAVISIILLLSFSVLATDHMIIIGTAADDIPLTDLLKSGAYDKHTHTLDAKKLYGDKRALADNICSSYIKATAKGVKVTALIGANLKCTNGKVLSSDPSCHVRNCSKTQIESALKRLNRKVNKGDNLILNTISHGKGYSGGLIFSDPEEFSYKKEDLAKALNNSGLTAKAGEVNGIFFQCFSGHFNDLDKLLVPRKKFCSLSQAKPEFRASQYDGGENDFIHSIWETYDPHNGGMNFIAAAALKNSIQLDIASSSIHRWGSSAENTARFYFDSNDIDRKVANPYRSIFGINDSKQESIFGSWVKLLKQYNNDFEALNLNVGSLLKDSVLKKMKESQKLLGSIEEMSNDWKNEYEKRDYLTTGLELVGYGTDDVIKLKDDEKLSNSYKDDSVIDFTPSNDMVSCLQNEIKKEVQMDALISATSNNPSKFFLKQKRNNLKKMFESSGFKNKLNQCLDESVDKYIDTSAGVDYKKFIANEKKLLSHLDSVMRLLKRKIRGDGKPYKDALNSIGYFESFEIKNESYGVQLSKNHSRGESTTLKDAIDKTKKLMSKNYEFTEQRLKKYKRNFAKDIISCPGLKVYGRAMAEINTLNKMNEMASKMKSLKTKNEFINKLMCEMGM